MERDFARWTYGAAAGALLLPAAGGISAAHAQDAASATGEAAVSNEIIVTARRRGEELSKVPAVVAAFSGDQLERQNITQQSDLQTAVPGLVVRQTQSNNYINYIIRGQSVDAFSGSPSAIVPYVNEVQFSSGGLSSFFDLESLQVLKGPQGTLFGRNATGGAVLLTTAKPVDFLTGSLSVSAGNFGYLNGQGILNVPLVDDRILLRAAVDITHRDGYMRNLHTGQRLGRTERQLGRVSLTVRPAETIENLTVFQIERSGGNNTSSILYSYNTCGEVDPTGRPLNCTAYSLFGPQFDAIAGPGAWATYLAAHPKANPGGIQAALTRQQQLGFRKVDEYVRTAHRGRNWFVTNTTSFELSDTATLKNIFGASRSHNSDLTAEVGAPYLILTNYDVTLGPDKLVTNSNDDRTKSISNELQLQGKLFDGSLSYIVGAYYLRTRQRFFYPATYTDVSPVFPIVPGVSTSISNWRQSDTQKALFGHVSYDFGGIGAEGLTLNAGYRYTWEKLTSTQLAASRFFGSPTLVKKFDKPSWNIGVDYRLSSNVMIYAQHRGSWRTGGINGISEPVLALPAQGGALYLPETTKDVEVGAKFSGEVGGQPAHLYLAAYRQKIKNIQRSQMIITPAGFPLLYTINVPAARVQGLEVDTAVRLADWLQLGFTGAYTDAEYTDNVLTAYGNNYFFGPYGDVPKWSGNFNAQVTLPLAGDKGELAIRADLYTQSAFYFSNTAGTRTPGTKLPGYELVNARIDWSDFLGQEGITASLFARNLFDKGYYTGGFALGDLLGVNSANVGEPRMWGAQLKYSF